MELSAEQLKPVLSDDKINVTLANPGSGKTTTLVSRAARLIKDYDEPILVCTFSKKAVNDLLARMPDHPLIDIRTLHGVCFDIIKRHWKTLGSLVGGEDWPRVPIIANDRRAEIKMLKRIFPDDNVHVLWDVIDTFRKLPCTPNTVLKLYNQKVYFGDVNRNELLKWGHYEKEKITRGMVTYDDMIELAAQLITLPQVSTDLVSRYKHLLVDEAQDTNEAQWNVIRPLVSNCTTSLVVGDHNQAIYGWRSADGSVLSNLATLPNTSVFTLRNNYRSSDPIGNLANLFMFDGEKNIITDKSGASVVFDLFTSEEEEVRYVMSKVKKDTAILARTNRYLEKFERYAIENGIKYSGIGFYRSYHIQELYEFLENYSGEDLMDKIQKQFVTGITYSDKQRADFKMVVDLINKKGIQYFKDLVDKSDTMRSKDLTISTAHSGKGLEWSRVFVVGVHPGHMPHKLNKDPEEERKILYVMITRPKDELYVTAVGEFSPLLTKQMVESGVSCIEI